MYNYEWDKDTGGYLLNTKITGVIKEVRPVFWEELSLLGFDNQFGWKYPQSDAPLMWAEARRYFYRGELVGEANGGGLYALPTLVSYRDGLTIEPIDVAKMVKKNKPLLDGLVQKTLRYIYDVYKQFLGKRVDVIYVAFSGGKDSLVLLDLVQRALPHDGFKVLFADTTMELPDTLAAVEEAKERWNTLDWHTAKSHMDSVETWEKIGPPAEKMRWCCSIHKTAPQVMKIKQLSSKNSFKTLVFVGMRAEESDARATYDMLSDAKKHIMQTSCCPILNWNTSELFLYLLENNLMINCAYRKGLTRAGCIFCPMSSNWTFAINAQIYKDKIDKYIKIIDNAYGKEFVDIRAKDKFYYDRAWQSRVNGRDIKNSVSKIIEIDYNGKYEIQLLDPIVDWKIWVGTIGELCSSSEGQYELEYCEYRFPFYYEKQSTSLKFTFEALPKNKTTIRFLYLFKNALYKSAYCINCKVCVAECRVGAIDMENGEVNINGCVHCEHCLDQSKGCIIANSLSVSGGITNMTKKSIGGYETRGLRQDWLLLYFELCSDFWTNKTMGPNMLKSFEKWAFESGLGNKKTPTELFDLLKKIGGDNVLTWGVLYVNLAYDSPLINWYVNSIGFNLSCDNDTLRILLGEDNNPYKASVKESAINSLKETLKASFIGNGLNQGICEMKGKNVVKTITRTTWENPEPLIILYSLYKFSEKMDNYYNFTINDLLDDSSERIGLSPSILFGLGKDNLRSMLQGLAHDYGDYIKVSFNKDLENINLCNAVVAIDIVKLFYLEG